VDEDSEQVGASIVFSELIGTTGHIGTHRFREHVLSLHHLPKGTGGAVILGVKPTQVGVYASFPAC
jgi:hypothetical protein